MNPETAATESGGSNGIDLTWSNDNMTAYTCVVFSVICCVISFVDLREHLARFDYPKLQILAMRIITMIPIYSIFSGLSLLFPNYTFLFGTLRDTYESFVLYMFFMLMIAYCSGEGELLRSLKYKRYKGVHLFPLCWLPMFTLDTAFYLRCKRWVLQCALIKPLCSLVGLITSPMGIYHEGYFAIDNVYTYTCVLMNISLTFALYYLVLFEVELEKELHYAKTFLKFLCIKSIIFFSYWQSVVISMAASSNLLYLGSTDQETELTTNNIQNVLMCFELLPVALLHHAAFGRDKLDDEMANVPAYRKEDSNRANNFRAKIDTALNVNDIIHDTMGTIFFRRGKLVDQENVEELDADTCDRAGYHNDSNRSASLQSNTHDVTSCYKQYTNFEQHQQQQLKTFAHSFTDVINACRGGRSIKAIQRISTDSARLDHDCCGSGISHEQEYAQDPTLDDLVRHAIVADRSVRVDGLLHYDEDSDRDAHSINLHFADTDVILRRSRYDDGNADARVDQESLTNSANAASINVPSAYCVVCGRYDRELVRRKNGYKCQECVGVKSQPALRRRQLETHE